MSSDRGLAEVVNGIGRCLLPVVDDDWRMRIEVSEVEAATAELADIDFVGLPTDAGPGRVPFRPRLLERIRDCALL